MSNVPSSGTQTRVFGVPRVPRLTLLVALALLPLVGLVVPTGGAAGVARAAPPGAPRVTLIGDSTMAAMRWAKWDDADADTLANNDIREIVGNDYDLLFSAESCRRLIAVSCQGREGYTPSNAITLMRTDFRGQMGKVVVIMDGYDDDRIDAGVAAVMQEAEAQGVEHVVWLTFRTSTAYRLPDHTPAANLYQKHNAALLAATATFPELQLADWGGYTADHPEWFATDGIHPTAVGAVVLANFIHDQLDAIDLGRPCDASTALAGTPSTPIGTPTPPAGGDAGYVARTPVRVLDTRDPSLGGGSGKVGRSRTVTIDVSAAVPANATAAVMTVTAADPCGAGFLTIFACGTRPETSNINDERGRDTAGMVISALDHGRVCIHSYSATDLVVDVVGAFVPGGAGFHPVTPTRFVDTRGLTALLPTAGRARTTGADTRVQIAGIGDVPSTATAVWLNLTVADPTAATVLLAYPGPCGSPPNASTVNARPGRSAASSAIVGLGPDGSICVRSVAGSSAVVVDVAGWFGPGAGGLLYRQHVPTRLLDTRPGATAAPSTVVSLAIPGTAVLNVTAADSTALGYLTVRPCDSGATSSLVNTAAGENTANLTAVGPGADGRICTTPYSPTHVVVDSFGDFVPAPA